MNTFIVLLCLILLSGFFALAEMALASARRAKLNLMVADGHRGAQAALNIKENPSGLLAGTQIGITAAALLMGVYGEPSVSEMLAGFISNFVPMLNPYSQELAFAITIALITAISIILGEIIPKRIAIASPEQVACFCAPSVSIYLKVLSPAIHILSWISNAILDLLPVKSVSSVTTLEDIMAYLDEGSKVGTLAPEESHLLSNVLRLDDKSLLAIMTPIAAVTYIDASASKDRNLKRLSESPHSQLPVCKGDMQHVIGIAESHDILQQAIKGNINFLEIPLTPPVFVPSSLSLIDLLHTFRQQKTTFVLVVNEFGNTEGIVTLDDVIMTLVGDMMPFADSPDEALAVKRSDGSWLLDGLLSIDEMKYKLDIKTLASESAGDFHTVGGYMLFSLGKIPKKSEYFISNGWRFEVVDVDGNRVDQVLAEPDQTEASPS